MKTAIMLLLSSIRLRHLLSGFEDTGELRTKSIMFEMSLKVKMLLGFGLLH